MKKSVGTKRLEKSLSAEFVRSVLNYDPKTGVFRWKLRSDVPDNWNTKYAGTVAGAINADGHRQIGLAGFRPVASRLAWLYMTGYWPADLIDHKNVIPGDDRWENLREANDSQNQTNCRAYKNNKYGFKGAYWSVRSGRWQAQIRINKIKIHLGYFDTGEEAHAAYARAAKAHHGEFARTS